MPIILKEGSKSAEDTFGISVARASELIEHVFDAVASNGTPTEDIMKIQAECVDEQEFGYALLQYGITSGLEIARHRGGTGIVDKLKAAIDGIR